MKKIDRKKVRELFKKGLSDIEIAKKLRCSPFTVAYIRRELRLVRLDRNLKEKILRLWEEGYRRPSAIAYRLKKHPVVVSNILVKLGLRKKIRQKEKYFKMYELLLKEPMFEDELKKIGIDNPRNCYKTLVLKGYSIRCLQDRNERIYFIPEQKNEALNKFLKRFPTSNLYNHYRPLKFG